MLSQNKQTAIYYLKELWEKHNLDVIDEVFSPDFNGHLVHPSKGKQGIKKNVQNFLKAFPNGKLVVDDLFGEGEKICLRWRYITKHEGMFFKYPPSGNDIVIKGITIEEFRDGFITELWAEIDVYDLLRQIGIL